MRAGLPRTTAPAGTSRVTTAPAPITAFSPMVTSGRTIAPVPITAPVDGDVPRHHDAGPNRHEVAETRVMPEARPAVDEGEGAEHRTTAETAPCIDVAARPDLQPPGRGDARIDQREGMGQPGLRGLPRGDLTMGRGEQGHEERQRPQPLVHLLDRPMWQVGGQVTRARTVADSGRHGLARPMETLLHIDEDRRAGAEQQHARHRAIAANSATAAAIRSAWSPTTSGWIGRLRSVRLRASVTGRDPSAPSLKAGWRWRPGA